MISVFTGAPGAGKTAAMVDLLKTLVKDRPIFVYGLDGLTLQHFPLEDPTKWMETVPDGAVVVIDEVQSVWRPRGPGVKVPDHVAALETHRHRGLDFFLTTQGPNLLDANVRALVGRHVHIRDLGVLGRWWYEWPECAENCRTGFRAAPIKRRYRLPKRVFGDYKSASIHVKPIRSFPFALIVAVLAIGVTAYLAWSVLGKLNAKISGGADPGPLPVQKAAPSPVSGPTSAPGQAEALRRMVDVHRDSTPSPFPPGSRPAAPVFAGCVVARGNCTCYDSSGAVVTPPSGSCERFDSPIGRPLALNNPDPLPRPSADLEADYAMIRATTKRSPLPLIY